MSVTRKDQKPQPRSTVSAPPSPAELPRWAVCDRPSQTLARPGDAPCSLPGLGAGGTSGYCCSAAGSSGQRVETSAQ